MAYNDTLFQLGMDLTRSSPAQKEEYGEAAQVTARNFKTNASIERVSGRFVNTAPADSSAIGTHVTIDVFGITGLDDVEHVETTLTRCVEAAGASLQHLHLHPVPGSSGISGVAVLDDGHISFHSRPGEGYAALDVSTFGGNESQLWLAAARVAFGESKLVSRVHNRGKADEGATPLMPAIMPRRSSKAPIKALRVKAA
jgi:S-adenosylmethionine decarboxylase